MEPPQPQRPRPTALEVRNKYGTAAAVLLALTIWFAYDGWWNPSIESKTFNKIGAVLLALGFVFCLIMTGSAALTVQRQRQQQQRPQNPPSPPQS